jgi:hypothetical protein
MYHTLMTVILLLPWTIMGALAAVNLGRRSRRMKIGSR